MALAGETIIAGKVPGERIATTIDTANSATTTTTEIVVDSVTASLIDGRTYRVRWVASGDSTTAGDRLIARVREDSLTGAGSSTRDVSPDPATGTGYDMSSEAEYTATSTGDKTFVATLVRGTGSGNVFAYGSSISPRYLYVDYIRG